MTPEFKTVEEGIRYWDAVENGYSPDDPDLQAKIEADIRAEVEAAARKQAAWEAGRPERERRERERAEREARAKAEIEGRKPAFLAEYRALVEKYRLHIESSEWIGVGHLDDNWGDPITVDDVMKELSNEA